MWLTRITPATFVATFISLQLFLANVQADRHDDDVAEQVTILAQDSRHVTWRIFAPTVTQPRKDYPFIVFVPHDRVTVSAGGCVQTGGHGSTWKRYVDASGANSDRIYHGRINIPGATDGLARIWSILDQTREVRPPKHYKGGPMFLQLGYEDGDNPSEYDDNGYWGHDDGTEDQCKGVGPAWVVINIVHGLPEGTFNAPPRSSMDLFWYEVDDNFLPLNPLWGSQVTVRPLEIVPNGVIPNAGTLCNEFHNEGDNLQVPCVPWHPDVDEPRLPNAAICQRDHGPGTVHGHINWGPATVTGNLYFSDFQKSPLLDGDYDLELVPDAYPHAGVTFGNLNPKVASHVHGGLTLEFESSETVDLFEPFNTWWRTFKQAVDADAPAVGLPDVDYQFPRAQAMVTGQRAMVTGLLGIDNQHADAYGGHTELHPVWTLALNTSSTAAEYVWPFFVRNWGDEGECSQDQHYLPLAALTFAFSWKDAGTTFHIDPSTKIFTTAQPTASVDLSEDALLVHIPLRQPEDKSYAFGELRFMKEYAGLKTTVTADAEPATMGKPLRYTVTVENRGPDVARFVRLSDHLPESLSYLNCQTSFGAQCGLSNDNTVVALIDAIPPNTATTISMSVLVSCDLQEGEKIHHTVVISSPTAGSAPEDLRVDVISTASAAAPTITAPPPVVGFTGPGATVCSALVSDQTIGQATAQDNCPGVSITRAGVPAGNIFPRGATPVLWTATNSHGRTATATQEIAIIDNTNPTISRFSSDTQSLWPVTHELRPIALTTVAADNCDPTPQCTVTAVSDELSKGLGPGDLAPDVDVSDQQHPKLRVEAADVLRGRRYTIRASCEDGGGNTVTASLNVRVARDVSELSQAPRGSDYLDGRQVTQTPNATRDPLVPLFQLPRITNGNLARALDPLFPLSSFGISLAGDGGRAAQVTIDGGDNDYALGQALAVVPLPAIEHIDVRGVAFEPLSGYASGATVDIVTKAGGRQTHGEVYLFDSPRTITGAMSQLWTVGVDGGGAVGTRPLFWFGAAENNRAAEVAAPSLAQGPTSTPTRMIEAFGRLDAVASDVDAVRFSVIGNSERLTRLPTTVTVFDYANVTVSGEWRHEYSPSWSQTTKGSVTPVNSSHVNERTLLSPYALATTFGNIGHVSEEPINVNQTRTELASTGRYIAGSDVWSFGGGFRDHEYRFTSATPLHPKYGSIFIQNDHPWRSVGTTTVGVRADFASAPRQVAAFVSPRLQSKWKINDRTIVRALAGTYYSPTANEVAYVASRILPSQLFHTTIAPNLDGEYAGRVSAGVQYAQQPGVAWDVSYLFYRRNRMLVPDQITADGVLYSSTGDSTHNDVSISMAQNRLRGLLDWSASYTFGKTSGALGAVIPFQLTGGGAINPFDIRHRAIVTVRAIAPPEGIRGVGWFRNSSLAARIGAESGVRLPFVGAQSAVSSEGHGYVGLSVTRRYMWHRHAFTGRFDGDNLLGDDYGLVFSSDGGSLLPRRRRLLLGISWEVTQ